MITQCAKLDSVAGESPRLFLKNYFREGDLRDTFSINSYVTINFPETLFQSFWIDSYVTINFQRHFLKINFCSRDDLRESRLIIPHVSEGVQRSRQWVVIISGLENLAKITFARESFF